MEMDFYGLADHERNARLVGTEARLVSMTVYMWRKSQGLGIEARARESTC
jgi:hypothetical protein